MADSQTGILVNVKINNPLQFLFRLMPVIIEIDRVAQRGKWGDNFIPATPGSHRVAVAVKLYWLIPVAKNDLDVQVSPGQVARVDYKTAFFWFAPGKISSNAGY